VTITIDGYSYCRENTIYVNPDSSSSVELGTMDHPYKSIDQAFIEVFNYWDPTDMVDIMVMESTMNNVFFEERPLIVNKNDNIKLKTYTTGGAQGAQATITVLNTATYAMSSTTQFSLMAGIDYDYVTAGASLAASETSAINSQWYAFVVAQADFTMDGFKFLTSLKLQDDDFAVVNPISNEAVKTLTIDNCEFEIYGTVMIAFTSISFSSNNVTMVSDNLVGGYVFLVTCTTGDVMTGEVVINDLTFDGARIELFKYGGTFMTGPQNFTVSNSHFGSYGYMFDAKQVIRADSSLNCQPTDGEKQIIRVENNTFDMIEAYTGTPHHGFICSFLEWYPRTDMEVYFIKNTMRNIQRSFYRMLLLDVYHAQVFVHDNVFEDSTSTVDVAQVATTGDIEVLRNTFRNISSSSQNIFSVTTSSNLVITDFTMNGANTLYVSSSVINLNMASGAVATLSDINFFGNSFLGTKAIVSQQMLSVFSLTASSFTGDSLMQNTNYFDIQEAIELSITDTLFENITYQNVDDSGAYLIYVASKRSVASGLDSMIQNVTFNNIKTNAISFGGFADDVTGAVGNLVIGQVKFMNSTFTSPDSLITTKKFSYSGLSQIIVQSTNFTDLTFTTFGNLFELTHNAQQQFEINSVIFDNIYGAGIKLEPQDIFDKNNPLTLSIEGGIFTDNTPWVSGFINVYENSIVKINNTDFNNTSSAGSGSVILANYKENTIDIENSSFNNNYAILGGVFYSQFSSAITCTNCTFSNNIAIRGGLAFLNSNGKIILNDCDVTENQALNAPVIYISACQAEFSEISGSQIYENNVITMGQLLARSAAGTEHLSDAYIAEVTANEVFYNKSVSGSKKSAISMIKGKIKVQEDTHIYNQVNFLGTFESEIRIIDSTFENITLNTDGIVFHLLSSTFIYTNSTMLNVDCPNKDEAIFQVRLESTFTTEGSLSKIQNTTCQFAFLLYSFAYLNDITFQTANLGEAYVDSIESTIQFSGTTLQDINTTADALMMVENSVSFTTMNSFFNSANKLFFMVTGSTLTFENSVFQNLNDVDMRAAFFEECTVKLINSNFTGLHYTAQGGAIDTLNSNVNITGSTFKNNMAPIAGGIALRCEEGTTCTYSVTDSTFENNTATTDGGAIYYDFYKPTMSGNTFINNTAQYGPDVAAYPVRIEPFSVPEQEYVSGQQIVKEIKYKLVDHDGLTIATDSDSVITVSPVNSTDKVIGNTDVTVINGVATFSDVTFISNPGATNINFTVSSSNIDEAKISDAFGLTLANTTQTLTLDFRQCIVGEEESNNMCTPCPTGKYSLVAGAEECNICPKHATCLGKDIIYVDEGYWRSSFASDVIHECLNPSACLEYDGTNSEVPYNCRKGYSSNLCHTCVKVEGTQYQRTGDNACGICPDVVLNGFRLLGLLILLVIFVIIVIWSNIRAQKDSPSSILIRILANYFQIITSAASFNLTFPKSLDGFFEGVKAVGESARIFLSIDCFVQDFSMVKNTGTTEYFKAMMTGLCPFIFVAVVIIGWLIVRMFKSYTKVQLKNRIIISICVVIFLLHPSITGMSLGLFNCYEIDSGEYWLFKDLSIKCWSGSHPGYAFGLGIPMILCWVIGLPVAGFLIVRHYRNRLDEDMVIFRYRILFQGYKREAYYWEFVNVFRKVSIVMINTFLGIYPPIYKTFVATLTLAIILRQQEQIQPYKIKIMNEVEFRESTASIVTLFGGMFFILEDLPGIIKVLLVIVIFACNLWFYSLWIHMFFKRSRFSSIRLLALFFGKISCLGKDYWTEEHKTLQSNHDMDFVFGKYDGKDTKYNKVEEESKDQSFQGYVPQDNIINDLSAGDTASLKSKEKQQLKELEENLKKTKKTEQEKGKSAPKKKKKRIIRKKKKVAKKESNDPTNDPEEGEENDEIEAEINEELDRIEAVNAADAPKKTKKKKKKKTARKDQDQDKVNVYPSKDQEGDDAQDGDAQNMSADDEAGEI
jgi:hypothetical protein